MSEEAQVLEALDIRTDLDPAEHVPNLLHTVRRLSCPECGNRPWDPMWTGSGWTVPWPHKDDCTEMDKQIGMRIRPALTYRRTT